MSEKKQSEQDILIAMYEAGLAAAEMCIKSLADRIAELEAKLTDSKTVIESTTHALESAYHILIRDVGSKALQKDWPASWEQINAALNREIEEMNDDE